MRAAAVVLAAAAVGCASTAPLLRPSAADQGAVATAPETTTRSEPAGSAPAGVPANAGVRSRTSTSGATLLETSAADLAAAIFRHAANPSVESEIELAQAFMRHGVLDKASEHFSNASRLDPRNGVAWDGLARLWRDWGFPQFGLGDAYRAVYAAPASPIMRNTLGTLLLALGKREAARAQFAQATVLDPRAAYAWNNLGYAWLLEGDFENAIAGCSRALAIEPNLGPAAGNLALARMMAGLAAAGGRAAAEKGVDHDRR